MRPGATRTRRRVQRLGWLLLAVACSPGSGPVRPEPGVGRPVDPGVARPPAPVAAAPDTGRGRVTPPVAEAPPARPAPPPTRLPGNRPAHDGSTIRVLLGVVPRATAVSADAAWTLVRRGDPVAVATGAPGRAWRIERNGLLLRAVREDGAATEYRRGPFELQPATSTARITFDRARYRGTLVFHATDSGMLVVNALPVEAYLGGVVPREIGARAVAEIAAVEAQAVAARSYAVTHVSPAAPFDVRATTQDQVYGGADAETEVGNRAVRNTRGLVLRYNGRTVNAPYHSTCGGSTAEAPEVWGTRGEPYLRRVSDRIPGTSRDYCDRSPRYRWTKTIDAATLDAAVARHLAAYAPVPRGGPGTVRAVRVASTTPSGRADVTVVETSTRAYELRGNAIRYVLRQPGGEILNSTYFSVLGPADARGGVRLEGRGYGHGIGMCQWGAIGRAREGQSYRTILQAYFPGTTVGPVS